MPKVIVDVGNFKPSFRNVFNALNEGKVVYDENSRLYYKLNERGLVSSFGNDSWTVSVDLLHILHNASDELFEEVESVWYNNIPEDGILCSVWDTADEGEDADVAVVYNYDKTHHVFVTKATSYFRARPLTLDEIKKHIYEN